MLLQSHYYHLMCIVHVALDNHSKSICLQAVFNWFLETMGANYSQWVWQTCFGRDTVLQLVIESTGHTVCLNTCMQHIFNFIHYYLFLCPCMVHDATMLLEAVWHIGNVICNGIPLSSLTLGVRQVFSLDMKASGDACQSWSHMMMAWGRETASVPLTWELFWVSALLW